MQEQLNRRLFLGGLAASCFTSAASAQHSHHHGHHNHNAGMHPFCKLVDIDTGLLHTPQNTKFNLVLFMTAQQNYASCGGSIIGVHQIISGQSAQSRIEPIFVMPKVSDQPDPADLRNLARVQNSPVKFQILTGSLSDIREAARAINGAFFETNRQGKVTGHTQEAFFLTPSGNLLLRHRADDYIRSGPLVERILTRCSGPQSPALCR